MNFCWVTLPVKNFARSLEFYHGLLGLPIQSRIKTENMEMAMLGEEDQAKIELLCLDDNKAKSFSSDITVGLAVKSLDQALEFLQKNKIPLVRGPISPNPKIQFVFIQDPDGYEVQLVEMKE